MNEDHVAAGTVEQRRQDLIRRSWAVIAKDALIFDAAGDLHSGVCGDLPENLVEAGIVGGDGERAIGVGDLGSVGRKLRWSKRYGRRRWCCCCRRGRGGWELRLGGERLRKMWSLRQDRCGENKVRDGGESDWREAVHVVYRTLTGCGGNLYAPPLRSVYREPGTPV